MSFEFVPCPLCGQKQHFLPVKVPADDPHVQDYGTLYAGRTVSEWKVCGQCGFVHQNPRPSAKALNDFYMQASYHSVPAPQSGAEHLRFARWYFGEKIAFTLQQSGLQRGSVFDIGCGRGGVLKLYEELGYKVYGVEPDSNLAKFAASELGLQGVRQGILHSDFHLPEQVDMVFSNHAFEHFADLDSVMRGVQNILKPGGYLFIAIPTYFKNRSRLSKQWMNSAHYSLFTHRSLDQLMAKYGFEQVIHTYSGWKKEVDDLWYLAKYTGEACDPKPCYEDSAEVARYLQVVNPLRSLLLFPIYSNWAARVRLFNAARLLVTSPRTFASKVAKQFRRKPVVS